MKAADTVGRSWWKRRPRISPKMTVCWLEEGVSLARWNCFEGGDCRLVSSAYLSAEACSAEALSVELDRLAGDAGCWPPALWLVARECLPGPAHSDGELPLHLPEWMISCWQTCPAAALPFRLVSLVGCMETVLKAWEPMRSPGTGLLLPMGSRAIFLANADGVVFKRISRWQPGSADVQVDADWIRQTRMLYRHRTGADLEHFFLPAGDGRLLRFNRNGIGHPWEGDLPPGWLGSTDGRLSPCLAFAHSCGLLDTPAGGAPLRVPALARRQRQRRLEGHLKVGVCVLLLGWMVLFLSACSSINREKPDPEAVQAWRNASARWHELDRRWRASEERRQVAAAPFQLAGGLISSAPEVVDLERIRVIVEPSGSLGLLVQGAFSGPAAPPAFREWMDRLQEEERVKDLKSLRFDPAGEVIRFSLLGLGGQCSQSIGLQASRSAP